MNKNIPDPNKTENEFVKFLNEKKFLNNPDRTIGLLLINEFLEKKSSKERGAAENVAKGIIDSWCPEELDDTLFS